MWQLISWDWLQEGNLSVVTWPKLLDFSAPPIMPTDWISFLGHSCHRPSAGSLLPFLFNSQYPLSSRSLSVRICQSFRNIQFKIFDANFKFYRDLNGKKL